MNSLLICKINSIILIATYFSKIADAVSLVVSKIMNSSNMPFRMLIFGDILFESNRNRIFRCLNTMSFSIDISTIHIQVRREISMFSHNA